MKRVDKPYYNIHRYCLDCHAKAEDKLKKEGKYKEHTISKVTIKCIEVILTRKRGLVFL